MRRRGFTMTEALVTIMLFALVLGLLANLLAGYGQLLRFTSRQDRRLETTRALSQLCLELQQAHEILEPGPGTSSQVVFLRPLPDQEWLPVAGAGFDPGAVPMATVRYFVNARQSLVRELDGRGAVVAESVGLAASWSQPGLAEVRLAVQEGPAVITLRCLVARP